MAIIIPDKIILCIVLLLVETEEDIVGGTEKEVGQRRHSGVRGHKGEGEEKTRERERVSGREKEKGKGRPIETEPTEIRKNREKTMMRSQGREKERELGN